MKSGEETFASAFKSTSLAPYVNMIHFGFVLLIVTTLNFKLCFSACARAEYEINGECCPMCAPGNRVHWHCTEDTSTTCVPCSALTYIDEPTGLDKCFPCSVCDAQQGLRVKRSCTRFADTICEPLEGFYCIEQNKGSCRFAVKHSECDPGHYIRQAGTSFTDTDCGKCTEGTYSNGSFTICQPHSICKTKGLKEIKPGTMSSDVECGKSVPVSIIIGVVVIIGVLVTAVVGIKIYCKLKQKKQPPDRDTNDSLPIQESNPTEAEERPTPEGACEPVGLSQNEATSPDSVTSFITRNSRVEKSPNHIQNKLHSRIQTSDLSFPYHPKDSDLESEAEAEGIMTKEKYSAQSCDFIKCAHNSVL